MIIKITIIGIGYIICIFFGSIFVKLILKYISKDFAKKGSRIEKAGMIIGFLERFIILTFILSEQYLAISFILTAKSIARFKELKDRNFAEYYLVGTLASISFSIFVGLIMKKILSVF